MEYLIRSGVPQRTAHHLVGELVRKAMERQVSLAELPLEELRSVHTALNEGVYEVLGVRRAIEAFASYGSTAPAEVARQVACVARATRFGKATGNTSMTWFTEINTMTRSRSSFTIRGKTLTNASLQQSIVGLTPPSPP